MLSLVDFLDSQASQKRNLSKTKGNKKRDILLLFIINWILRSRMKPNKIDQNMSEFFVDFLEDFYDFV